MDRNELIEQIKQEYANLASMENRDTFINAREINESADEYYEKLLESVIEKINQGTFDGFNSGQEILEAVANNKAKWLGEGAYDG